MSARLVPSAPISIYKTSPEPVGPTCQLCDNTGHAARSCPTYLNEVEANRELRATVDRLHDNCRRQTQRLAALDDQVMGISMQVVELAALVEDDDDDDEQAPEFYSVRMANN